MSTEEKENDPPNQLEVELGTTGTAEAPEAAAAVQQEETKNDENKSVTSSSSSKPPGCWDRFTNWCKNEYNRPQDESSNAMVQSLLLFAGGYSTIYAMTILQKLYLRDAWFWDGSPTFARIGALEYCGQGLSILLAFPQTVSEALAGENESAGIIVGSLLSFSALLLLTSNLGAPSVFPMRVGYYRTLINTIRILAPVVATFFVPRLPTIGPENVRFPGDVSVNTMHVLTAGVSFLISPVLEFFDSLYNTVCFFTQKPIGAKYLPVCDFDKKKDDCDNSDNGNEKKNKEGWNDIMYKVLWSLATLSRLLVACFLLFVLFPLMVGALRGTQGIQVDACGALRTIRTFVLEKILVGLLGAMYVLLSLSQLCESSGRRALSLVYVLPLFGIGLYGTTLHFIDFGLTTNMEENYLKLLDIPPSGFLELDGGSLGGFVRPVRPEVRDERWTTCTAKFDMDDGTYPPNCFQLDQNPGNATNESWFEADV